MDRRVRLQQFLGYSTRGGSSSSLHRLIAATLPVIVAACAGKEFVVASDTDADVSDAALNMPSDQAAPPADDSAAMPDSADVVPDQAASPVADAAGMPDSADVVPDQAASPVADATMADAAAGHDGGPDAQLVTNEGGCSGPPYRDVVLSDKPILYFRLGEASNSANAVDEVAGGATGKYSHVASGVPGAIACDTDTAAHFNGTAAVNIASVPDFAGQQSFAIEAWVKPTALSATNFAHIFSNEYDDARGREGYALIIGYSGYGFGFERAVGGALDKAILGIAPATMRYTHVVGVYDGAALLLYTDGVAGPTNVDVRAMLSATPPISAILGAFSDLTRDFTGDLDEVALYDHALTPARVTAHYTKGAFGY